MVSDHDMMTTNASMRQLLCSMDRVLETGLNPTNEGRDLEQDRNPSDVAPNPMHYPQLTLIPYSIIGRGSCTVAQLQLDPLKMPEPIRDIWVLSGWGTRQFASNDIERLEICYDGQEAKLYLLTKIEDTGRRLLCAISQRLDGITVTADEADSSKKTQSYTDWGTFLRQVPDMNRVFMSCRLAEHFTLNRNGQCSFALTHLYLGPNQIRIRRRHTFTFQLNLITI